MPQNWVHMWPVHVRYNYGKFSLYMCCFWALIITYCSDLWCYWLHGVLCKSLYHWYTLYCTSDDSVVLLGSPSPAPPCKKQYILSLSPSLSDLFLMSPLTLLIFVTFRIKFEDDDLGPSEKHDQEHYCDPQSYLLLDHIGLCIWRTDEPTDDRDGALTSLYPMPAWSVWECHVIDLDEVRFCDHTEVMN